MARKLQKSTRNRLIDEVPPKVAGVQVNFCRNPHCANYGQPARDLPERRGRTKKGQPPPAPVIGQYALADAHRMTCGICGTKTHYYSNGGVFEEKKRIENRTGTLEPAACTDRMCINFGRLVSEAPDQYRKNGKTGAGRQRYQCLSCGDNFTGGVSAPKENKSYINPYIVREVVNGSSVQAILRKKDDLTPHLFYKHLAFVHRRMLAFEAVRIRELKKHKGRHFSIATDYQDYIVNWPSRDDRRTTQLTAIGSADNLTGFVFSLDLAFDPHVQPWERFVEDYKAGEFSKPVPHWRILRFRLLEFLAAAQAHQTAKMDEKLMAFTEAWERAEKQWASDDEAEAAANDPGFPDDPDAPDADQDEHDTKLGPVDANSGVDEENSSGEQTAAGEPQMSAAGGRRPNVYLDHEAVREHVVGMGMLEAVRKHITSLGFKEMTDFRPPKIGALVDKTYTAIAHYAYLDRILPDDAFLLLFTDEDGSTRTGALTAMHERVRRKKASISMVRVNKLASNDEREAVARASARQYSQFRRKFGLGKHSKENRRLFIYMESREFRVKNNSFTYHTIPYHTKYEPGKSVGIVYMPDFSDEDFGEEKNEEMLLTLLDWSSLHSIDSFFSLVRARAMYAARGESGPNRNTKWYRRSAYNPLYMQMALDIMRVYFNWVETRTRQGAQHYFFESPLEKKTPAMRLGLAKAPIRLQTILETDWEAKM